MENPHNFKVGDKVVGNEVNGYLTGCICVIKKIDHTITFDYCKNGIWRRAAVGTLKVFRPLTPLEKLL